MRYYIVLAIFALATILSLKSVTLAGGFFLWNNLFQPLPFAYSAGRFDAAWYVFYVLIASYVLDLLRGKFRPRINFYVGYSLILLSWIAISASQAIDTGAAWSGVVTLIKYLLPLLLIFTALEKQEDVRFLSIVVTLSVGVWSAQAGVYGLVNGQSNKMFIPGGQMSDNNDFMAATVSIIPMLIYLTLGYQGRFRRTVKLIGTTMAILSVAAIVFSGSRGAALGLAGCAIMYLGFISRRRLRDGILLCFVLGATFLFLPDSFWERMSTINFGLEQVEGSAAQRMEMMRSALACTLDYPIFGVGKDCWLQAAPRYSGFTLDPHNIWLKLSAELGLPGLILYLIIPVVTIARLLSLRRRFARDGDRDSRNLATTLVMVIIGYLLPSTFLSHPFAEFLWAWYGIGNIFVSVSRRRMPPALPSPPSASGEEKIGAPAPARVA